MFGLNRFGICFLFVSILVSGLWGCAEDTPPVTCEQDGTTYNVGDSFPADDGCNSCSCTDGGEIACTLMACPTTCEYDGKTYNAGDSFPAGDGCNTCSCQNDGSVGCTEEECPTTCEYEGETYNAGETFPAGDGCNTCNCQDDGQVACTEIFCPTTCEHGGETYNAGETFPAGDGCNTCNCQDDGQVACTEIACPECPPSLDFEGACDTVIVYAKNPDTGLCCEYPTPCESPEGWEVFYTEEDCAKDCSGDDCPDTCDYEGQTYYVGDSWDASDGCNTCSCHEDGQIACTLMFCPEGCASSAECGANQVCDFEFDNCGMWGQLGTCIPRPEICPAGGVGACGCDGSAALNTCELQAGGNDALQFGGCHLLGSDLVRCGEIECDPTTHLCTISINDIAGPGQPEYYNNCSPIPDSCAANETVDCSCMEISEMVECYDQAEIVIMVHPGG